MESSATGGRWRSELRPLLRLALPLCAAQLGLQLMSLVDTAVVGRLGAEALGGVGLGNSLFFGITVAGLGMMMGLDPLMSQAVGAKDLRRARQLLWQGSYLAVVTTLALLPFLLALPLALVPFGVNEDVAAIATSYLRIRVLGVFPLLLFGVLRAYLQAFGRSGALVTAMVLGNVLNLGADILLVHGGQVLPAWAGPLRAVPALGTDGSAIVTVACTLLQVAVLAWAVVSGPVRALGPGVRTLHLPSLLRAARVGLPVGLQQGAEVGVFGLVGVLAARLGPGEVAAHQIALTLASMTFMVAVGVSTAGSVRVGQAIGAGNAEGTRRAGVTTLLVAGLGMSAGALTFLLFPASLARLLTDDVDVITRAAPLLAITAAFQLSDGLQAAGSGILRGAGDTRFAFLANVAGHWLVGLPVALLLGVYGGHGVVGLWIGLATGLSSVAAVLTFRFLRISSQTIHPLEVVPEPARG